MKTLVGALASFFTFAMLQLAVSAAELMPGGQIIIRLDGPPAAAGLSPDVHENAYCAIVLAEHVESCHYAVGWSEDRTPAQQRRTLELMMPTGYLLSDAYRAACSVPAPTAGPPRPPAAGA